MDKQLDMPDVCIEVVDWMNNFAQVVRLRARVIEKFWPLVKEWFVDQSKLGTLDSEIHQKR